MIYMLVVLSVLCAAIGPYWQTEAPPEEVQTAVVMDMTDTANPQEGWYSYQNNQWVKWDTGNGKEPPESKVAAYASQEMGKSISGVACICAVLLLVILFAHKRKCGGSAKGGVSQVQYQALMRRLDTMAAIVENVAPNENGGTEVLEKRGKRHGWK